MLKTLLAPKPASLETDIALLLLRLATGSAFAFHGLGKIQTPFSWMPAGGPMSIPPFFQGLAALSEFGGGIALAIGLLSRLGALGIAITMAVAVYFHAAVMHDPFVVNAMKSSYETPLVYLFIALLYVVQGPGRFSPDRLLFGTNERHGN